MHVTTFWCEWDIGCNDDIFSDEDVARAVVEQALIDMDLTETMEELEDQGLLGFDSVEVRTD